MKIFSETGNINILHLGFRWSLHTFHKFISSTSQIVRLTASGLSDFALHCGFLTSKECDIKSLPKGANEDPEKSTINSMGFSHTPNNHVTLGWLI